MNATVPTEPDRAGADHPEPIRYVAPGHLTRRVMNPIIGGLTRVGISVQGARILEAPGRRSGKVRSTVVNLLDHDGTNYLVSPRGETHWVRNLRAAGGGTLRTGRRRLDVEARELDDGDKAPIIRAYLRRWAWEVGQFFDGLDANASDAEIAEAASSFPVFALRPSSR